MRTYLIVLIVLFMTACGPSTPPVPVGEIPEPQPVTVTDEQYGHEVLGELTRQYSLDTNDARIERVRSTVDKLTKNKVSGSDPWHVYVLADKDFKNAAATRGNYIFIWSGMVDELKTDAELAAILAHEVAHVLAGHTNPDPYEQANEILSGVAGTAAQVFVSGTQYGALAQLSAVLVQEVMKGLVVNPDTQRKELEADHIGLMLMAEAKYDPNKAIDFWERAQHIPELGGGFSNAFFSSHPSNEERLEALRAALPEAMKRYKGIKTSKTKTKKKSRSQSQSQSQSQKKNSKLEDKSKNPPPPKSEIKDDEVVEDSGGADDFVMD